jgi:hypothetical protein
MVQTVLQVYEPNLTKPLLTQSCQNSTSVMNYCGTFAIFTMREGMRRTARAVCIEIWYYRLHNRKILESCNGISNTLQNGMVKRIQYKSKNRRRRPEPEPVPLFSSANIMLHLCRIVKAKCWQVRMRLRQTQGEV